MIMHNPEARRRPDAQASPHAAGPVTLQNASANQILHPRDTGSRPGTLRMRDLTLNERQRIAAAPREQVAKAGERHGDPIVKRRGEPHATWLIH